MAGGTQTRKRAAHLGPERRRPEVLNAALELFLESGYQGTSMEAVARAAGVTKPVVYACFDSKDELFRSLLAREEKRILGEIQAAFEGIDLSDPETTLIEGFTELPARGRRLARRLSPHLPRRGWRQHGRRQAHPGRAAGPGRGALGAHPRLGT